MIAPPQLEHDAARVARIGAALRRYLTPNDLTLPRKRLAERLTAIGRKTGLFGLFQDRPLPDCLTKIDGAAGEWTVVLQASRNDLPCVGFWIGARGRAVGATALPDSGGSLEGPLIGSWRRRGAYRLAAGVSLAFHSPAFADGRFLVLREHGNGLKLLQQGRVEYVKAPVAFRSALSNDLVSYDESGEYETLEGFRATSATRQTIWRFRGGRYAQLNTRTVHDRLWALDRLVTAVRRDRRPEVASVVRVRATRTPLIQAIRRDLARGRRRIDNLGDGWVGLFGEGGYSSDLQIHFAVRGGRWVVDGVRPSALP